MKLDELHVAEFGASPKGHGKPVTGGDGGVGGVTVDVPRAAGSQQDAALGAYCLGFAGMVNQVHAAYPAAFEQQIGSESKFDH